MIKRFPLVLVLLIAAAVACAEGKQDLPPPIQALQAQGILIVGRFEAPDGLTGYAGILNGEPISMYLTEDGRHVIVGFMVNGAGEYVDSATVEQMTTAALTRRTALMRLDGTTVQLAQLAEQPMIVNIWATWCPPCRREMPMLEAAQQRYPGITFVFVNQGEGPAAVRAFLKQQDLQLKHVLIDFHGAITRTVGSNNIPTTLFYGPDGRLVAKHIGAMTAADLDKILQRLGLKTTVAKGRDSVASSREGALNRDP